MQTFINIALDDDCRWRRVIDGQLKDKNPPQGGRIKFFDIEDNAIAYMRGVDGSHIFLCTKKMEKIVGSIRPKLLAILNDDELCFSGRIVKQLRLPTWFTDLEEDSDRRTTIINELPNFSTWVNNEQDDHWVAPEFGMALLAKIVDKLLTAVSENERAKIVIACDGKNLEKAQKLLYYALRCIPVKLANQLTFNTAAKEMASFDICCGNFSDAEVKKCGGVRINIEEALSDQSDVRKSEPFKNAYAYYIQMLSGDSDPCKRFYDEDDLDTLNATVYNEVLEVMGDKLTEKCKKNEVTVEELSEFADRAKGCEAGVKKQLHQIADYLCLNYIGFTNSYLRLNAEYQDFYASFVTNEGGCPSWGNVETTDSLFSQNDERCNSEYIKILYDFWVGAKKDTVYKNNKTIEQFLFLKLDERFQSNTNLYEAFVAYWDSLTEDAFLEYLSHGTVWDTEVVSDYMIKRNDEKIVPLVECCCKLKTDKGITSESVSKICNKWLSSVLFKRESEIAIDDLRIIQKMTTENGIILDACISKEIQTKFDNERIRRRDQVIDFLSRDSRIIEELEKTKQRDRRIAKNHLKKKEKTSDINAEVVAYNIARLRERDCGEAGNIHNADWGRKLRTLSAIVGIFFALQMVALVFTDILLFNKLYIYGFSLLGETIFTLVILTLGSVVWVVIYAKKICSQDECDHEQYESTSTKMLVGYCILCFVRIVPEVLLVMIILFLR